MMGTKQDVIDSIAQTAEFLPYSSSDLITYINEYGFDVEGISGEVLYRCDSALISEGIIDQCVLKIANYLGIENLDENFLLDNREEIIDELICQNHDLWGEDEETFLNNYKNPFNYIFAWIDTCLRAYLTENPEEIGLNKNEDDYEEKIEDWLTNINEEILEKLYQEAEIKLASLGEDS